MKIDYNDIRNMNALMENIYFINEQVFSFLLNNDEPDDWCMDSFELARETGEWAREFEEAYKALRLEDYADYLSLIEWYAEQRVKEYFKGWTRKVEEK